MLYLWIQHKCNIQVWQHIWYVNFWITSRNRHYKAFKRSPALHLCNLQLYMLVSCQRAHLTWLHERCRIIRPWNVYSPWFKHFHLYLSVWANLQSYPLKKKKKDLRCNSAKRRQHVKKHATKTTTGGFHLKNAVHSRRMWFKIFMSLIFEN